MRSSELCKNQNLIIEIIIKSFLLRFKKLFLLEHGNLNTNV